MGRRERCGTNRLSKKASRLWGFLLLASVSPFLSPPPFPCISTFLGLVGSKRVYAVKSGLEITRGFLGLGGGVERRTVNRTLAPARNGFTQRQRQQQCRFLKEKVKVGRGQKRNPLAVGHQGVFGKTPLFQQGAAMEKSSRRRGLRAAPMGAEGWCLLLCVALSQAADTAEKQWQAVDVVLDCFLAEEGKHHGGFASRKDMVRALLVLRQVPVLDDGSLEGFADFQLSTLAKDSPPVTFEASVNLVQIPHAEALLHADCSETEVTCEISRYFPQARQEATVETAAWFITNMQVSGGGPSVSIVMRTLRDPENVAVLHPTVHLPQSPQGTVLTAVELQVSTDTPSLNFLLGSSASLRCNFSMAPGLDLTRVEWRLQHRGNGQLVYSWTTGQGQAKREGATLEPEHLLMAGDASLNLPSLTLKDEGAYICQVTTSLYQAQQIIQLHIQASPKVRLHLANEALPPTLICNIVGYYPLDVTVTWTREELGGAPTPVSDASFSSLRESPGGTYSISSSLTAEPGSAGAAYTCQVTHVSLDKPIEARAWVAPPEQRTSASGILFASSLFLLALLYLGLQRWKATSPKVTQDCKALLVTSPLPQSKKKE